MTVHIDLIELEVGGWLCKSPQYPAWRYRAPELTDDLQQQAEKSLRSHIRKTTRFVWFGWDGRT